jgi:hypothetical protein
MNPGEALVAIASVFAIFGSPVAIMYIWTQRRQHKVLPASPATASPEARLERIGVVVHAIALETERIAEGQRFTTRLLTSAPDRFSNRPAGLGV